MSYWMRGVLRLLCTNGFDLVGIGRVGKEGNGLVQDDRCMSGARNMSFRVDVSGRKDLVCLEAGCG